MSTTPGSIKRAIELLEHDTGKFVAVYTNIPQANKHVSIVEQHFRSLGLPACKVVPVWPHVPSLVAAEAELLAAKK